MPLLDRLAELRHTDVVKFVPGVVPAAPAVAPAAGDGHTRRAIIQLLLEFLLTNLFTNISLSTLLTDVIQQFANGILQCVLLLLYGRGHSLDLLLARGAQTAQHFLLLLQ